MTVAELIAELQKLPPHLEVMKSNSDGCNECNEFGYTNHHDVDYVRVERDWNWHRNVEAVIL